MVALVLAIFCTFSVSVLIKLSELRGVRTAVLIASNYLVAACLGWGFVLAHGWSGMSGVTFWLGLGGGLLWPGTLHVLAWGIRRFGVALVGSVARLALVVPVMFGLLFLQEELTWQIGVGVLAAVVAFLLLSPLWVNGWQGVSGQKMWYFPMLVLVMGIVEVWANLFVTYGVAAQGFLFLTLIFSFAALFAWVMVWWQGGRVAGTAVRRGLWVGVPNFFATFFMIETLKSPLFMGHTAVAYSLYSVAGVVLVFMAGALVWRERVTAASVVGVLVAVAAIVLLNNF
jgi:multidrug transporter EmrE-like cation transporter